ncbi:MAG: hypothetical protein WC872_04010 [Candidatus Absconditabacterales bacterium]
MFGKNLETNKIQKSKHDNMFNTESMLPISEIKNDTMILKDGGLRAILKISGLNLDLKNFDEQQIVLEQYKKFLNGLDFPIQILIRNTYLDLSNYLNYIKFNIEKIENPTLQKQSEKYFEFLQNIDAQQGLIYNKEFYIIVPYYQSEDDNKEIKKSRREKLLNILNTKDSVEKIVDRYRFFVKGKKSLETRCNLIIDGLGSMSINAEKIGTAEIINLLFRCYNPLLHSSTAKL